jgi:co-chaperonin GroES (HSP10)
MLKNNNLKLINNNIIVKPYYKEKQIKNELIYIKKDINYLMKNIGEIYYEIINYDYTINNKYPQLQIGTKVVISKKYGDIFNIDNEECLMIKPWGIMCILDEEKDELIPMDDGILTFNYKFKESPSGIVYSESTLAHQLSYYKIISAIGKNVNVILDYELHEGDVIVSPPNEGYMITFNNEYYYYFWGKELKALLPDLCIK